MTQHGEEHHGAKLTYEQVRAILERSEGKTKEPGWKQLRAMLASNNNVSIHTVERIATGRAWVKRGE